MLSQGGRLIKIKHVLSSIPLHVFAALKPPKSVVDSLERLFSTFLWGTDGEDRKRVWRSWDRLAMPVKENGLGVRCLHDVLKAFSCKLWWKWKRKEGLWASYVHSVSLQRSFAAKRLAEVHDIMSTHTGILVRDGESERV